MQTTKTEKLDKLVKLYQQTGGDEILGVLYHELEMLIFNLSSSYWGLTKEDVSSFAFETVYQCLQTYRIDGGAKFTSYFATSFKFRLRAETLALNQHKRKANLSIYSSSYEEMVGNGFNIAYDPYQEIYLYDALERTPNLTDCERLYCRYLVIGKYSNEEIAGRMKVSVMTLCNMRKRLQVKLKELFINQ